MLCAAPLLRTLRGSFHMNLQLREVTFISSVFTGEETNLNLRPKYFPRSFCQEAAEVAVS